MKAAGDLSEMVFSASSAMYLQSLLHLIPDPYHFYHQGGSNA